jgi:parallel beta-helix repeat protein
VGCALALSLVACGDDADDAETGGADASDGSGDGDSDGDTSGDGDGDAADGCDTILEPGGDDTEALQTALIEASSGDVICLSPGTYMPLSELSLSEHRNVTLRGIGEAPTDVIVDFADQDQGDDGIVVTADGFTIEHMWVKNTPGNGVMVKADDSVFRDLHVTWDAGAVVDNGAYAVYPTNCNRTIIENVHVEGAADAGIYVGQCTGAIVRNNRVLRNVIGIEVENTSSTDVYGNEVEDNTVGVLAVIEPNLMKKDGREILIRENLIRDNNHANFAQEGTTAGAIPPGCGVLVLATDDVEVRDNEISAQSGPGIFVGSYEVLELLTGAVSDDAETDKWSQNVYLHGNSFDDVGQMPMGDWTLIGVDPLPAVVWDGVLAPGADAQVDMGLCLGEAEAMSFRKGTTGDTSGLFDPDSQSTDPAEHECTPDPMPELSF